MNKWFGFWRRVPFPAVGIERVEFFRRSYSQKVLEGGTFGCCRSASDDISGLGHCRFLGNDLECCFAEVAVHGEYDGLASQLPGVREPVVEDLHESSGPRHEEHVTIVASGDSLGETDWVIEVIPGYDR